MYGLFITSNYDRGEPITAEVRRLNFVVQADISHRVNEPLSRYAASPLQSPHADAGRRPLLVDHFVADRLA
jgi:hypothetical protein